MSERSAFVFDPGPFATIQDRGRFGFAHLGVPRAGALDARAAEQANLLVGNTADEAVLEVMFGPFGFTVRAAMAVAVTGVPCGVLVSGRPAAWGEALSLAAGDEVRLSAFHEGGVYAYVAFAGGVDVAPVLGSRSSDTLSWIGHPPLAAGIEIPIGHRIGNPARSAPWATPSQRSQDVVLRYVGGPRDDWFEVGPSGAYAVDPASNRVGLRLVGSPLRRTQDFAGRELSSEGIVLGAIEVPANGQPLVFLNDHPTTGGYPVVGVVVPEDLPLCAQLRPGAKVTLHRV